MSIETFKIFFTIILSFFAMITIFSLFYLFNDLFNKIRKNKNISNILTNICSVLCFCSAILFFIYENVKNNSYINIKYFLAIIIISSLCLLIFIIYQILFYKLLKLIITKIKSFISSIKVKINAKKHNEKISNNKKAEK